jgi:HPt (histidine-containing phosphotransfer) domain-containing protein
MDMQMPEMDGLAATRALRADPALRDLPIIAMTANAMKADLDACLEAGMNDHVTKPIDRKALVATLRRWLPARPPGGPASTAAVVRHADAPRGDGVAPALEGIDVAGALDRLGLDFESLARMLARFADAQPAALGALRAAVEAGDAAAAARHAHAIAGAAGNLGADTLRAAAKALEQAGREGRTGEIPALHAQVEAAATAVLASIARLGPAEGTSAVAPAAPLDRATTAAALRRLDAALGDFDLSAATAALAELRGAAPAGVEADRLEALRRHVDGYEYDEARAITARLLDGLGEPAP